MIKTTYRIFLLLGLCTTLVSWGSKGHYTINNKCPESFPSSMAAFRVWADSLDLHGSDADNRKNSDSDEGPKHYLDIDNYTEFNSTGRIASTYDSIVSRHGSTYVIDNGTLPWATRNMFDTLKADFKSLKWHKAMLDASDLGHYVGDGHMPLHITANYDGQKTGQSGIHSRYESTMVATYISSLSAYSGSSVQHITNINKYIFDYIYTNHHYVDSVLAADTYARGIAGNTTSSLYYSSLWSKTRFSTTLFKNASHALAELIYTAWVDAGSPAFGAKTLTNAVNNTNVATISVYPNPTNGMLNLNGDDALKTEVCTITGTNVGVFYNNLIDLSHLSNGMYILSIYNKEGLLKKEKILLAK
ncbi:MAG TPA: T9SS type A sorting domain-containing protein [Paludibacter sp.]|nr:T9SS type A sorting domain-containing protein [Paludibacter sp.]